MTRLQFWILNGLGLVIIVLLIGQVLIANMEQAAQLQFSRAQLAVQQGEISKSRLQSLALRIYQVSQQTNDQGLKDLLVRQDIRINVSPSNNSSSSSAPADSTPSTPASTPTSR